MMFYQHSNKKSANETVFMTTFAQDFFFYFDSSALQKFEIQINDQKRKIDVRFQKKSLKKLFSLLPLHCRFFQNFDS
jgi:hypothetical protein